MLHDHIVVKVRCAVSRKQIKERPTLLWVAVALNHNTINLFQFEMHLTYSQKPKTT